MIGSRASHRFCVISAAIAGAIAFPSGATAQVSTNERLLTVLNSLDKRLAAIESRLDGKTRQEADQAKAEVKTLKKQLGSGVVSPRRQRYVAKASLRDVVASHHGEQMGRCLCRALGGKPVAHREGISHQHKLGLSNNQLVQRGWSAHEPISFF